MTRKQWAKQIREAWRSSLDGVLEAGRLLIAAKAELEHGQWLKMIDEDLPFDARTTQRLMAIAHNPVLAKTTHGSHLPPSWRTLYEISRLPEEEIVEYIEKGVIHPGVERRDIATITYKAARQAKHKKIQAEAKEQDIGSARYPLIYADPPWKFQTYSEKGLDRTPDQHYVTLSDEEIINFCIGNRHISDVAAKDAALFLWCTSSNERRAMEVMEGWGFEYKTSAVWDKGVTGLGLVFRNQHEPLLYGTRGNMPGPQYQPASVFRYPRGEHSAKPPEVRGEIEKMYPDFDEKTRLELFARATVPGWTAHGYEASRNLAA